MAMELLHHVSVRVAASFPVSVSLLGQIMIKDGGIATIVVECKLLVSETKKEMNTFRLKFNALKVIRSSLA